MAEEEKIYIIPLRKEVSKAPNYKRTKKAIRNTKGKSNKYCMAGVVYIFNKWYDYVR